MTKRLHLLPRHRTVLVRLLQEHLPGVEVWAYGSRVNGRSHDGSDLDLVLRGPHLAEIPTRQLGDFEEALQESSIPFIVEARDWFCLPERFHREIERDYVVVDVGESAATHIVEDTGGGAMEQLPSNCGREGVAGEWTITDLGSVTDLLTGFPFKSSQYVDNPSAIRLLRGDNIAQGVLRWDGVKRWPQDSLNKVSLYELQEGDAIIAMDRPWIDAGLKYATVRQSDLPALLVQRVARLRGSEHLETAFLKYVIGSTAFTNYVLAVQTGTAVPHISGSQIKRYEFALPPLAEQRTIAHILGSLDDKIEVNRRMNATLESMARAVFKDWFVDFGPTRAKMAGRKPYLTSEIWDLFPDKLDNEGKPEGWTNGALADLVHLNPEVWTKSTRPEKIRYVDLANTKWGRIEAITDYSRDKAPSRAQRVLRPGDTIVGTVRPGNGSFAFIADDGLTGSTGFALLRPRLLNVWELIYLAATSEENISALAHVADGAAYPAVRAQVVAASPITIPSDNILGTFSDQIRPILAKIAQNNRESRTLAQTRDLLLPKLMSGEIHLRSVYKTIPEQL